MAGIKRSSWNVVPPLVLVAAVLAFCAPALTGVRRVVVGSARAHYADAVSMFYPLRSFANAELQQGRLPLWNPYVLCGHPLHAEGQAALFYPLNLLLAAAPPQASMNLFAIAHFAAAGVLFYGYLREVGLRRSGAFFGGFVYLFSSGPISRLFAGHYTILPFLALVPALMWAWEAWRKRGRASAAVCGGISLGLMVLAGYPQMVLYASLYLGWHAASEAVLRCRQQPVRSAVLPLAYVLAVLALGAWIGAVQLFPSYVFAKESFRQQATYEMAATFSFAPENLLTLLFPRFFGDMGSDASPYWGRHLLWENWIYIGVVPLALVAVPFFGNRRAPAGAHGTAVLAFFVLALGRHTPLHRLLYDFVPFFSYFRGSAKFSFFALFSLVSLAAMGADELLQERKPGNRDRSRLAAAAALALFAALGVVAGLVLGNQPAEPGSALGSFVRWRLAQGETYVPSAFFSEPDLGLVWAQAWPQIARAVALSLLGLAVVGFWPSLRRSPRLACAALCLATVPDLWQFAAKEPFTATVSEAVVDEALLRELAGERPRTRLLAPALPRNALVPHRVETPLGYVGNLTRRYNGFLTAVNGVDRSAAMLETPLVRPSPQLLWPAVNYLLADDRAPVPADSAVPIHRGRGQTLYRLAGFRPRAGFSQAASVCGSFEEALAALESGAVDLSAAPLLEVPAGKALPLLDPPAPGDSAEVLESVPTRTVVRTRTAGRRLLVLADSFESGWRCRLEDGSFLGIYPANVAFRGVLVPPGDHTLTFSYEPRAFSAGAGVSTAAVVALVAYGVRRIAGRRKFSRAASVPPA